MRELYLALARDSLLGHPLCSWDISRANISKTDNLHMYGSLQARAYFQAFGFRVQGLGIVMEFWGSDTGYILRTSQVAIFSFELQL